MKCRVSKELIFGLILFFTFTLASTLLTIWNTLRVVKTENWVAHTLKVQTHLDSFLAALIDAETGQRGYLLTGEILYLESYNTGRKQAEEHLQQLLTLTADNPGQQQRLNKIIVLVKQKFTRLERIISQRKEQGINNALKLIHIDRSDQLLDEIRAIVRAMRSEEERLLKQRSRQAETSTKIAQAISVGSAILGILLIVVLLRLMLGEVTRREHTEDIFCNIFHNSIEGIFQLSPTGRFLQVNTAMAQIHGYDSPEEMMAQVTDFSKQIHVDSEAYAQMIGKLESEGMVRAFEARHYCKDGSVIWTLTNARAVRDASGKILYYEGFVNNITEQKQAENALREKQQLLERITQTIPEAIHVQDIMEHKTIFLNNHITRVIGYLPKEIQKDGLKFWSKIIHPDDQPRLQEVIKKLETLPDGEVVEVEYRIRHAKGNWRWIRARDMVFNRNTEGKLRQFLAVESDITESKQKEEALRESEEKYRKLFEEGLTGNCQFFPDGKINLCNSAFTKIFGFRSVEDALQANMSILWPHPQDLETFLSELQDKKKLENYEQELRRKDGQTVYVIGNFAGEFDKEGKLVKIKGYFYDITERKQLQEQLFQSQKMEAIGRLAGGVAHDFNNLLTVILGYSGILLSTLHKNTNIYKQIELIRKAGERAAALTSQLLAFSRKQVIKPKILNLNNQVKAIEKILYRLIGEDIKLITVLDENLGNVKVDKAQIDQVIMNLVVNARDAMPQGGKITLETRNVYLSKKYAKRISAPSGNYVMLSVSDTGIGMDKKTMSRIFEPFFTTKEKGKGTGLGLSTVYGIVKQSGGYISVDSTPGKGTTFKIYFPQIESTIRHKVRQKKNQKSLKGSETILLVEDDPNVRNLIYNMLSNSGFSVLPAEDGDKALQICQKLNTHINMLITDVVLPGISGRELSDKLATIYSEMKVLYISGYTVDFIVRYGISYSDVELLQKPFDTDELLEKVKKILNYSNN